MKKEIIITIFILIFTINIISAANEEICGDSYCNAGRLNLNQVSVIEDASTCFEDCESIDYIKCKINILEGGICNYKEIDYTISELIINSTPIAGKQAHFKVDFKNISREFRDLSTGEYFQLVDDKYILIEIIPIESTESDVWIYIKGKVDLDEANDFFSVETQDINLNDDKEINMLINSKIRMSHPYCYKELINIDTQKSIAKTSGQGCYNWTIPIKGPLFIPGNYVLNSTMYDMNRLNLIAEKSVDVVLHECDNNDECSGSWIFKIDKCSKEPVQRCYRELNKNLIYMIFIVIAAVILIILFLIVKLRDISYIFRKI